MNIDKEMHYINTINWLRAALCNWFVTNQFCQSHEGNHSPTLDSDIQMEFAK